MKIIRRYAEFIGYMIYHGEHVNVWCCPKCGQGLIEDYTCCPYCRQKVKFKEPESEDRQNEKID